MSLNNSNKKPRESMVMKFVNLAGTAVMLNLAFLVACLPLLLFLLSNILPAPFNQLVRVAAVIVVGPSLSGLYSGVRFMIRKDGPIKGFWEGFRTHFVRSALVGMVITSATVYLFFHINAGFTGWQAGETGGLSYMITHSVFALIPAMLLVSLAPLNIYIDYSLTEWLKNGVNLIFKAPHWVLLSTVLLWAPVICLLWVPAVAFYGIVVIVGFWFTLAAFVSTLFLKDALIDLLEEYRDEHPELYEYEEEEE